LRQQFELAQAPVQNIVAVVDIEGARDPILIKLETQHIIGLAIFLASVEISKAFPLSSIQIVLILLASKFILKERITQKRWIGGLLIMIGIYLIGAVA
jgi:multidrug transporter EmrE-like cation transporter